MDLLTLFWVTFWDSLGCVPGLCCFLKTSSQLSQVVSFFYFCFLENSATWLSPPVIHPLIHFLHLSCFCLCHCTKYSLSKITSELWLLSAVSYSAYFPWGLFSLCYYPKRIPHIWNSSTLHSFHPTHSHRHIKYQWSPSSALSGSDHEHVLSFSQASSVMSPYWISSKPIAARIIAVWPVCRAHLSSHSIQYFPFLCLLHLPFFLPGIFSLLCFG